MVLTPKIEVIIPLLLLVCHPSGHCRQRRKRRSLFVEFEALSVSIAGGQFGAGCKLCSHNIGWLLYRFVKGPTHWLAWKISLRPKPQFAIPDGSIRCSRYCGSKQDKFDRKKCRGLTSSLIMENPCLSPNLGKSPQLGVLTMAYGDERFIKQAELLAISIKVNMPHLPVALVSDVKETHSPWFDYVVPFDPALGGGMKQKLYLDKYSPFQETLYVDSDCIVSRPFEEELREIREYDFTPVCDTYLTSANAYEYVADFKGVMEKLGISRKPEFNGGLFFFKKNRAAVAIFDSARDLLNRQTELGIRNFDRHGPNDETLYSLALGMQNSAVYNDSQRLMRTTIAVTGKIHIQPLRGGCRYVYRGKEIQPAICHFVRSNVSAYSYLKCEWILRRHAGQLNQLKTVVPFLLRATASLCIGWLKVVRYRLWVVPRNHFEKSRGNS